MEKSKVNMKAAPIIVAGGYGVGSRRTLTCIIRIGRCFRREVGASVPLLMPGSAGTVRSTDRNNGSS